MDTINAKMTALADEIRELSGTTDKLGIDEMTSVLDTENTNFNSNLTAQDSLIEQIKSALQGKAAGGGGSNNVSTISVTIADEVGMGGVFYFDANGKLNNVLAKTQTVDALAGIVFIRSSEVSLSGDGVYDFTMIQDITSLNFSKDGGTVVTVLGGGGM